MVHPEYTVIPQSSLPNNTSSETEYFSGYGEIQNGELKSHYPFGTSLYQFHHSAHQQFKEYIASEHFPCVGGKAAINKGSYVFAAYSNMESGNTAHTLFQDLIRYGLSIPKDELKRSLYTSFIATFNEPKINSEEEALRAYYILLRNLHAIDRQHGNLWAPGASANIESPHFDFSINTEAYVVVLSTPFASNPDRKSPITLVTFNSRVMFENLKRRGILDRVRAKTREKERNPMKESNAIIGTSSVFELGTNVSAEMKPTDQALRQRILGKCPFSH